MKRLILVSVLLMFVTVDHPNPTTKRMYEHAINGHRINEIVPRPYKHNSNIHLNPTTQRQRIHKIYKNLERSNEVKYDCQCDPDWPDNY